MVLVAHADKELQEAISVELCKEGCRVATVTTGADALAQSRTLQPGLVLLDVALPGISGLDLCQDLKAGPLAAEMRFILLSHEDNAETRIGGFEGGADDFVTTPCNFRELALRAKAVLRRSPNPTQRQVTTVGPIVIDHAQCAVRVDGHPIILTPIEFRLLAFLAASPGDVQTRGAMVRGVWGDGTTVHPRNVDTSLRRLRAKLGKAACHVETVRGFGYRLAGQAQKGQALTRVGLTHGARPGHLPPPAPQPPPRSAPSTDVRSRR